MRVLIVANGIMKNLPQGVEGEGNLVICADGGARHALALGLRPQVVIGDLDSFSDDLRLKLKGCQFIVHPARKEKTDLELALDYALERGADDIVIIRAGGGRLDQTMANLLLLAKPELAGMRCRMWGEDWEAAVIRKEGEIGGQVGETVSLFPLTSKVEGIYTQGLEYSLENGTLEHSSTLGVSNCLMAPKARVRIREGTLLVIRMIRGG